MLRPGGGPERPREPAGASNAPVSPRRGGELVAAIRQDPPTFNRYAPQGADNTVEAISQLVDGKLVRVDRLTGELQPWLAERWTESEDHLTFTLTLRDGLKWSDGQPFTSADVLFTFQVVYDARLNSPIRSAMLVADKPIAASSPDPRTVVLTFPAPYGPGLRVLDNLTILPRHKLEAALGAGTIADAWGTAVAASDVVGMGPFRLTGYAPAERVTFERNPHYWRKASGFGLQSSEEVQLPYLDTLTLAIVRDQNTEILRIENGQIDISAREIRPEDYGALRREADRGRLKLADAGVGLDPNMLWFNLAPGAYAGDPRKPWLQSEDFRKAISHAIDRGAIVDQVYSGVAVPVYGPVSPGNTQWYEEDVTRYEYDPARARALLTERLGFVDRDSDGMLEDRAGRPVRFALLTQQQDTIRTRTASVIQAQLKEAGIAVDVVGMDPGALVQRFASGDYDAIYFGVEASSTDPANNLDFWLSSGSFHVWNPGQKTPGTPWEKRIDDLMQKQIASPDQNDRRRLFSEVQQIFAEHVPILYLATPRLIVALSPRVANARPAPLKPLVLWSADTLAVR
jgi:peptide/nickel transport system substrate-binding protein